MKKADTMAHLCHAGAGVDVHGLWVLDGPVPAILLQIGCVVEEAGCNGLLNAVMVPQVAEEGDLCPVHEPHDLIPNVIRPLHAPLLHSGYAVMRPMQS